MSNVREADGIARCMPMETSVKLEPPSSPDFAIKDEFLEVEPQQSPTGSRSEECDEISMWLRYKKMMCTCGKKLSSFTTSDNPGPFLCSTTCLLKYGTSLPVTIGSKKQKNWIDFLVQGNAGKQMVLEIPKDFQDYEIPIRRVYVKQQHPEAHHQAHPAGPSNPGRRNLFHPLMHNASAVNPGWVQNLPVVRDYAPTHPQQNYHQQHVHDGQFNVHYDAEGRNFNNIQMCMTPVPNIYNEGIPNGSIFAPCTSGNWNPNGHQQTPQRGPSHGYGTTW